MKRKKMGILWFALVLSAMTGCVSYKPVDLTHETIIEVPDKTKAEIYVLANKWMTERFVSAESVIQFSSEEQGSMAGDFVFSESGFLVEYQYKSLIQIDTRDNGCRLVFKSILTRTVASGQPPNQWHGSLSESQIATVQAKWAELEEDLKDYILSGNTDW